MWKIKLYKYNLIFHPTRLAVSIEKHEPSPKRFKTKWQPKILQNLAILKIGLKLGKYEAAMFYFYIPGETFLS